MNINYFGLNKRWITVFSVRCKNHYDVLGLTSKATQGEIKAAYYKLSKLYHPDKNQTANAVNKFKDITSAYEVLGNFKMRKLYDRGLGHFDEGDLRSWDTDSQKVKGGRMPTTRGQFSGRTPIYDFDEWSRVHYSRSFERMNETKAQYKARFGKDTKLKMIEKNENVVFSVLLLGSIVALFVYAYKPSKFDTPRKEPISSEK